MDFIQKTKEVMGLQDSFNKVVNPNWQKAGYPFYRAAWLELAEFIEHVGTWKWWKAAAPGDRKQAILELVDVFHFVLSDAIIHNRGPQTIVGAYQQALKRKNPAPKNKDEYVFEEIEAFIELTLTSVRLGSGIPLPAFFDIIVAFDVTYEELITLYYAKNTLNKFRQDHGYKDGIYKKNWFDEEDNVWVMRFAEELGNDLTFDVLYAKLLRKYQDVT